MDEQAVKAIEEQAKAYHDTTLAAMSGLGSNEANRVMAKFADIMSMQELYDADKFGYLLYRVVFGQVQESADGSPLVLLAPVSVISHNIGVVTPEEVEEKLLELSGTVMAYEVDGVSIGFPVISVVSQVRVEDEAYFYVSPHGVGGSMLIEMAVATHSYHYVESSGDDRAGEIIKSWREG